MANGPSSKNHPQNIYRYQHPPTIMILDNYYTTPPPPNQPKTCQDRALCPLLAKSIASWLPPFLILGMMLLEDQECPFYCYYNKMLVGYRCWFMVSLSLVGLKFHPNKIRCRLLIYYY